MQMYPHTVADGSCLPHVFTLMEDAPILRQQQTIQQRQAFRIEIDEGQLAQEVAEITEPASLTFM